MVILLGIIVGAILGFYLCNKFSPNGGNQTNELKAQLNELYTENEKLRERSKTAERQIEDLLAENKRIRTKSKDEDDDRADLEDEVSSLKSKLRKATIEIDSLSRDLREAKEAYASLEKQTK